jgi:hypothetical protein
MGRLSIIALFMAALPSAIVAAFRITISQASGTGLPSEGEAVIYIVEEIEPGAETEVEFEE